MRPSSCIVAVLGLLAPVLVHAIPGDPYTIESGAAVHMLTDAFGKATFSIRAGGEASSLIDVWGNYVYLGYATTAASPDQDGNGIVDAADAALLAANTGDKFGDLNLDGHVDAADAAVLTAHLGHACANPTPVRAATWGQVRQSYR